MLVIIESPYMGNVKSNVAYARKCMSDSLLRGESPFASHLLNDVPACIMKQLVVIQITVTLHFITSDNLLSWNHLKYM